MSASFAIEPLAPRHARAVAAIHLSRLTGLLTALGGPTSRVYYQSAAESKTATAFVALSGDEVIGFVLGGVAAGAVRMEAPTRHPMRTVFALTAAFVLNPRTMLHLAQTRRGTGGAQPYDLMGPELTYLAVKAGAERNGVGHALVDTFTNAMRKAGMTYYELSVDHDNRRAIRFYERIGFVQTARYTEFGVDRLRFRLNLAAGAR